MSNELTSRGRYVVLPIVGDTLIEIRLSACAPPALVFKAADHSEAEITVEESIILRHGDHTRCLDGSKPGEQFNPTELGPLLELLGSVVTEAVAGNDGFLRLAFSNKRSFEVTPTHGYEAWHFQRPRPGRAVGGTGKEVIALTGAHGRLI